MNGVFINATRSVCTRVQQIGVERGGFVVAVRSPSIETEPLLAGCLDTLWKQPGVVRIELWRRAAVGPGSTGHDPRQEEQIRGQDEQIGCCLVIHATRPEEADSIVRYLREPSHQDLEIGLYRFLCELRHEECQA